MKFVVKKNLIQDF